MSIKSELKQAIINMFKSTWKTIKLSEKDSIINHKCKGEEDK